MSSAAPSSSRPRRGDELELTIDSLAYGGNGVARRDGYVVFVAGGLPGDRVRAVVGKAKRAYAEARAVEIIEPSPDRLPEVADHPGAPWQVLPYERQLEVKAEQVEEALTRIGHLEGFELEPIVPARRAVALPQQARVLVRHRRGRDARVRLPRPRPLRPDPADDDCKLASERGNELREPALAECRAPGPERVGPARPARLPAQPRRARGAPHRRVPGPARHLAGQARRRRADRRGPLRGPVLDPDRGRSARARRAARRSCSPARRSCASGSATSSS